MNHRAVFGQNEGNVADERAPTVDGQDAEPPFRDEP